MSYFKGPMQWLFIYLYIELTAQIPHIITYILNLLDLFIIAILGKL